MKKSLLAIVFIVILFSGFIAWGIHLRDLPKENLPATALFPTNGESPAEPEASTTPQAKLYPYIEVLDSCTPYYEGICVNMRSGPGLEYPVVLKLRTGMVFKVADSVVDTTGRTWYKIAEDATIRYPERVKSDWYVAADPVHLFYDDGDHRLESGQRIETGKRIVVDLSEERLYAYDGDSLFMEAPISTGLEFTPTPRGTFTVYKMTPSRYMQGPIPGISDQEYDLPGVPWNLYFTADGAVVHGAYWHENFGKPWSHGCVNLWPQDAKKLYLWAQIGIPVTVRD